VVDNISVAKVLAYRCRDLTGQLKNERTQQRSLETAIAADVGNKDLRSKHKATVAKVEKTKGMLNALQLPAMLDWNFVNKPVYWKATWLAKSATA